MNIKNDNMEKETIWHAASVMMRRAKIAPPNFM